MKKQNKKEIPEIVIPKGYDIDEFLDMDDGDFDEEPIYTEEVRLRFERE